MCSLVGKPHRTSGFAPANLPLVHSPDEEVIARVTHAELPYSAAEHKECESFIDAPVAHKASLAKIEEINIIG